jgi:tRNA(Ile)-lysidine synthase
MRGRAAPLRLRHRVLEAIRRRDLWQAGDRVAVAVSGGLDSVALLDLLVETRRRHGAALSVVTIDHGLRPESADDAAFVEALAADRGLPCVRADLALGRASEAEARSARYAVFDALEVDRVALAHHRDDLAETVLLHLLRGTGTVGLAGMRWRRGRHVRPLLGTTRDELAGWAAARSLGWRDDSTNRDLGFLRNRLRHEVLPLLESVRPGASRALARSASVAAADAEHLDALVDADPHTNSTDSWPTVWVATAPEALVRRALLRRAPELGSRSLDAVIAAANRGYGRVPLPGGRRFEVDGERVVLTRPDGEGP